MTNLGRLPVGQLALFLGILRLREANELTTNWLTSNKKLRPPICHILITFSFYYEIQHIGYDGS